MEDQGKALPPPQQPIDGEALAALKFRAQLVTAMNDAVIATDPKFRVVLINKVAAQMYGLDASEIVGSDLLNLVETDLSATERESAFTEFTESGAWSGRLRQRGPNGNWIEVDATITTLRDDSGQLLGSLLVVRDVTTLLAAQREASELAEFAVAVLESLPGRTCVLDNAGIVVAVNRRYREEGPAGAGPGTGPRIGTAYDDWLGDNVESGATEELHLVLAGKSADYRTEFGTVRRRRRNWTELFAVPLGSEGGGAVITHVDITVRKQAETALTRRATHDPLTGLPNRTLLADRLSHALSMAARTDGQVGLLFCDLDGLRAVNNSLGHLVGDRLLVTVAKRLRAVCRASDTVARVSGDEFVVIFEDVETPNELEEVAQRIIDALGEPVVMEEVTARTGASVGLLMTPGINHPSTRTVENLIRDADAAMYAAKEAGRARYVWFSPELRDHAHNRPGFVQAINRLLNR